MKRTKIADLLKAGQKDIDVLVKGWVRTQRGNKQVAFIALNDGSTIHNMQIVVDFTKFHEDAVKGASTGASLAVWGKLVESQGKGQTVEVIAEKVEILGLADPEVYPLQPKKHSLEFLREKAHLRMRTNTFSAVFRVRHALSFAVHKFFNDRGFFHMASPIITGADAEGAGEMFKVTTLDLGKAHKTPEGHIDHKEDFFGKATNLTVSGQLEAETGAMALGQVYTFGPTFRAENSNTTRHLAEFWMIEPEVAFNDLHDNMDLAESFVRETIKYALEHCADDLAFLDGRLAEEEKSKPADERSELGLKDRLAFVVNNDFERITYTEAVEILLNSKAYKKDKFKFPVGWGVDLQSEHERYLVEQHFKKPVILTDYPKDIKAFYMKLNPDCKTVAAMDILFPGIGEIVGGSQREENLEKLTARMEQMHISTEELWWYLELRQFGTVPHAGFGLGFERLVLFVTGMTNIRDVIPFPRTPQNAEF